MARANVVARSRDISRKVMGRSHTNPKLDTRTYQVKFAWGEVTELTVNVIAELIYTKCNADRNKYLLLVVLNDY